MAAAKPTTPIIVSMTNGFHLHHARARLRIPGEPERMEVADWQRQICIEDHRIKVWGASEFAEWSSKAKAGEGAGDKAGAEEKAPAKKAKAAKAPKPNRRKPNPG